jgi:hypothetical protein
MTEFAAMAADELEKEERAASIQPLQRLSP